MEELIQESLEESATDSNTDVNGNGPQQGSALDSLLGIGAPAEDLKTPAPHPSVAFTLNGRERVPVRTPLDDQVALHSVPEPGTTARVSLVIPAKNEEKNLPALLTSLPDWLHEVILVNGVSHDATDEVARQHLESIRIIAQKGRGKGDALREGFAHCTGDMVIAIDADGSMDPGEIGIFVAVLESGFDYVRGSRMIRGGSSTDLTQFRRFGNWFFRTLTNRLHRSRYSDLCYGSFGFRRGTIDTLDLRSDGFEIETEISIKAHQAGLRTAEIPSTEFPRSSGTSNLRAIRDGWRILCTILRTALPRS
jgi:hypothetical protein